MQNRKKKENASVLFNLYDILSDTKSLQLVLSNRAWRLNIRISSSMG